MKNYLEFSFLHIFFQKDEIIVIVGFYSKKLNLTAVQNFFQKTNFSVLEDQKKVFDFLSKNEWIFEKNKTSIFVWDLLFDQIVFYWNKPSTHKFSQKNWKIIKEQNKIFSNNLYNYYKYKLFK